MKELFIFFVKNTKIYKKLKAFVLKLQNKYELIITPELLFSLQHKNSSFNRYDIVVRYLAIENHFGKNDFGMELYNKLQDKRNEYLKSIGAKIASDDLVENKKDKFIPLIESFEKNGFDLKKAISVNEDLGLVDGSHRLACALYFKSEKIAVKKNQTSKVDYGLDWFEKYFTEKEIELISNKYKQLMSEMNLHDMLIEVLKSENQTFGRGDLYQSLDDFDIPGQRPTNERFGIYKLEKHLKSDFDILDIGSNCGFLTLKMAEYVKSAKGIEIADSLVHVSKLAQTFTKRTNVQFVQSNFNQIKHTEKYDFICSFAVHFWLGADITKYAKKLHGMLNPNGMVLFESQNIETFDKDWDKKVEKFKQVGFEEIETGELKDDGKINRRFSILKKI